MMLRGVYVTGCQSQSELLACEDLYNFRVFYASFDMY